jgi:hypothetical protein
MTSWSDFEARAPELAARVPALVVPLALSGQRD